jgi:putative endonuclease
MTTATNRVGRIGEQLAVVHLEALGYRIEARNWRTSVVDVRGELDIVARDGDILVFCEVMSRRRTVCDDAFAAVTWTKQRQVRRLAALYLAGRAGGVDARFDVVAVAWPATGGAAVIDHIKGAF